MPNAPVEEDRYAYHILPENDIKDHDSTGLKCHCNPIIEPDGPDFVVKHIAYDNRSINGMTLH